MIAGTRQRDQDAHTDTLNERYAALDTLKHTLIQTDRDKYRERDAERQRHRETETDRDRLN